MRMVGCVIRVADRVYPLSDEPEWRGFAWVADEDVGFCVVDYLNKRLGRTDQVVFSSVMPTDGTEWILAEEQADGIEGAVMLRDPQLSADFYTSLSPEAIEAEPTEDIRYHLLAIRAALQFETLHHEEVRDLIRRILDEADADSAEHAQPVPPVPSVPQAAPAPGVGVWVRADQASERSGLSADAIRKRADREGWAVQKSGKLNCYRLDDLARAWPHLRFSPDNGGK